MKIGRRGSSMRQIAYARRVWGAEGESKRTIALDVGYSPNVANSVASKVETRKGFQNAMARLAAESNNLALSVMSEFKARGFEGFTNAELIKGLGAISGAWDKFNKGLRESEKPIDNGKNKLRTIVLQNIQKQVNPTSGKEVKVISPAKEATPVEFKEVPTDPDTDMDF